MPCEMQVVIAALETTADVEGRAVAALMKNLK